MGPVEAASEPCLRPSVIVVLIDGCTPLPEQPPPGSRVVVGLVRDRPDRTWRAAPLPGWARVVDIEG